MATPAPPAETPLGFKDVLKLAPVRRLWIAQIVSIFGDFLAIFGVFTIVPFQMHGTAAQIALIFVAYFLPLALISPIAGVFVDRWNVKATMIASDLLRAGLVLLLIGAGSVNQIYAILFALSAVSSFFIPAQSVALRAIVPRNGLMSANALMSQALQGMQILGPAATTQLVAWFGANPCFWLDSVSFLFSAAMISSVDIHRERSPAPLKLSLVITEMNAGLKFIFTHAPVSFVMISMTAGMFAIRCYGALIAVYIRDILMGGPRLLGTLSSLVGVGMIIGAQFIHRFARNRSKNHLVVYGLLSIGVCILVLAAVGNIPTAVAMTLGIGFGAAFIMIPSQTLLQEETPHAMLGRVTSSLMSALSISQVVAMLCAGSIAQAIGIRNLYFASAGLLVLIAGSGYLYLKRS
jgi:DHA3 family macrolide efflux protein-like MFS transporter